MVQIKTTTILIYLLAIQELSKRKKKLKNNDLAKVLSVSPASVSEMLAKLRYEDYLDIGFQLILYLIFDYPHKHYTFKHFEV
ncbi:helix-turn-helix domain-containing protein [Enterococcus faecium]|uniref:iron-dependent repressor n=1 Tax=Enterococcus faecium TaxID=1352 RepID=UPI001CC96158|nr:iron-dependent repressor [Enterococcus faecium]